MNTFFFRQPKFPTLFPEEVIQYNKKNFFTCSTLQVFLGRNNQKDITRILWQVNDQ